MASDMDKPKLHLMYPGIGGSAVEGPEWILTAALEDVGLSDMDFTWKTAGFDKVIY